VDGQRQLDHAQIRAEVTAVDRDSLDDALADLLGELVELARRSARGGPRAR
jgi:hypothetical protein